MPRVFGTPTVLLRALESGCPDLSDAIATAMRVTGADPEVHILRDQSDDTPFARWSIAVSAGADYIVELELDMRVQDAAQAALSLFLVEIVESLRNERPDILRQPIVIDTIVRMLRVVSHAAGREMPS